MGIWTEKWEQYKAGVDLDGISTFRKMFFKTNPTDDQILYLDMIQARHNGAWVIACLMFSMLTAFLGGFWVWLMLTKGLC